MSKKKKFLVKVCEPRFIHYTAPNKEKGIDEDITIMEGKYALPWRTLTDTSITERALARVERLKRVFPDVSIEFNFIKENPAFILGVSGKATRHSGDTPNQSIGDMVARARAMAKACEVGRSIAVAVRDSLVAELNGAAATFKARREREKRNIKKV